VYTSRWQGSARRERGGDGVVEMLKRRLGRTNFEASVIGFGGGPFIRPAWEQGVKAVRRAIELGVNLIDTARQYGESEAMLGEAIKGARDRLFISTKSHFRTKEEVARSIDESLRQLQVDKIDLIHLHSVDREEDLKQCLAKGGPLEAMRDARAGGKVDYIGISGHRSEVLVPALKTGEFDAVIVTYNLINDDAKQELLPLAQEMDVGVLAMKPLDGGFLAVPREAAQLRVADRATSTVEAALRFALSNPAVATVLVGMVSVAEVEEDVPMGFVPQKMPLEDRTALQARARGTLYTFCQGCGYCLPQCPEDIDIPRIFKLQVLLEQYRMKEYARVTYREVFRQQVEKCTGCESCMERCPSQLDIPELLRKADLILS